jgi:hypothetical protein
LFILDKQKLFAHLKPMIVGAGLLSASVDSFHMASDTGKVLKWQDVRDFSIGLDETGLRGDRKNRVAIALLESNPSIHPFIHLVVLPFVHLLICS